MVSAGDDVHSSGKKFTRNLRRDAIAASGIFAVGNDEIQRVLIAQSRQNGLDRLASGFAHDVTDEQDFHEEDLTTKDAKDTK